MFISGSQRLTPRTLPSRTRVILKGAMVRHLNRVQPQGSAHLRFLPTARWGPAS